ncbi:MAG TPA: glycosyltransferase [Promineifilum sp.]|nr:glycosyltransferase [Promineifilum sp.]HRO89941.1 glycosyltransferase [Promineifilum sp.]HRQ12833.1 glycosyltransferase [Promineifilum sp.]
MAHITIVTTGSRGDVQPFIALGLGLTANGHTVRLATHTLYADWIQSNGLGFSPVEGDPMEAVQGRQGRDWMETGRRGLGFVRGFRELIGPILHQATADVLAACDGTDLILFSGPAFYTAYNVAEKLGKPFIQSYLQPVNPTREFPSAIFPTRHKGGALFNYATHVIGGQLFWQMIRPIMNDVRRDLLKLRPFSFGGPFLDMLRRRLPVVHGYSPTVLPKPHDWNESAFVTGFWFQDDPAYTPSEALATFLASGEPPVYVGFGSMTGNDPERLTAVTLEALRLSGRRGVLLSGWAGLAEGDLPDSVLRLDAVPHDWLFPHMAAVVHHGGVGTTHVGLRAGVPNVVVPFFGDQPFWGDRVYELGAGPRPISQSELTAGRLAAAIETATSDEAMRSRAAEMGRRIQAERGVEEAVAIVNRYLAQRPAFFEGIM